MTTKEFLDRYDSVSECFTERELKELWWSDFDDENVKEVEGEVWGEPDRWNTCVTKVIQVGNRYFVIYRYAGNTEYQDSYYDQQPEEIEPYEITITAWRPVK